MATAKITLIPIGGGNTSCSLYVARALDAAAAHDELRCTLHAMGTELEGDVEAIFSCVRDMQESVFDAGAERCYLVIKLDDRRDKSASSEDKMRSVMAKRTAG